MVRRFFVCMLFVPTLLSPKLFAQPGDRYLFMKAQVLDALFPLDVAPKPYMLKMVLRFGDTDSQLMVVLYPGRKAEVIRFRVADMSPSDLEKFISRAVADNSRVTPRVLAARLKLDVTRASVDYAGVSRGIDELKSIRISPVLPDRISIDDYSEYEFWYDTWQEAVHYTIAGLIQSEPVDELGKWMLKFRVSAEEWLKPKTGLPRSDER